MSGPAGRSTAKPRGAAAARRLWGRIAVAVSTFLALTSTLVYVLDVRQRYDNKAPAPWGELEGQLRLWHAGGVASVDASGPSEYVYSGVTSRPVDISHSTTTTTHPWRSSTAQQPTYRLREVHCEWRQHHFPHRPPPPSPPPSDNASRDLYAFFLHGNAGGASQGDVWHCGLALQALLLSRVGTDMYRLHAYTFDFAEQANIHRGRLLESQADFVADAVESVLRRRMEREQWGGGLGERVWEHGAVWLMGHSMGGIVARTAAALLDAGTPVRIEGVVTFNSPHRYPPLLLDPPLRSLYTALLRATRTSGRRGADVSAVSPGPAAAAVAADSASFVAACGDDGSDATCERFAVLQQLPHRPPSTRRLLSLTSGEMDMQIEPATTFPAGGRRRGDDTLVHLHANMQEARICGHAASHDGAIRDACMVAYAAAAMGNLTRCHGTSRCQLRVPTTRVALGATIPRAALVVALPDSPLLGWLGRRLWRQHLWPLAAAVLSVSLLLFPLARAPPGLVGGGGEGPLLPFLTLPAAPRRPASRRGRALLLGLTRLLASPPTAALALVSCVNVAMAVGVALAAAAGAVPSAWETGGARPWVWDRWLPPLSPSPSPDEDVSRDGPASTFGEVALHGVRVMTLSWFAMCVGGSAGVVGAALLQGARHLSGAVLAVVALPCGGRGDGGVGACASATTTPRDTTCTKRGVVATAALAAVYGGSALLSPLSLTWRAILWVTLSLIAAAPVPPELDHRQKAEKDGFSDGSGGDEPTAAGKSTDTLCTVLYAVLHLVQLQPVFTIRNEILSATTDNARTVGVLVYLTELCVVVQLCPALGPAVACLRRTPLPKSHGRVRSLGPKLLLAVSYVGCIVGCVTLAAAPTDMSALPVAMLLAFPSFLLL